MYGRWDMTPQEEKDYMKPFKFLTKPQRLGWTFEHQMLVQLLTYCKRNDLPFGGAEHTYSDQNHFTCVMKIVSVINCDGYYRFVYIITNLTTNTSQLDNVRISNSVIRDLLYVATL